MTESFVRAPGVIARKIAGELVLMPSTGSPEAVAEGFFVLNETGERLWEWLSEPQSPEALARRLMVEYSIDEPTALGDVRSFLQELRAVDAVRTAERT